VALRVAPPLWAAPSRLSDARCGSRGRGRPPRGGRGAVAARPWCAIRPPTSAARPAAVAVVHPGGQTAAHRLPVTWGGRDG